jgi:hypothetical protein
MKTIYEDTVDFEPLGLRFVIGGTPSRDRCEDVARFVVDWMGEQEREHPQDWKFCEYRSNMFYVRKGPYHEIPDPTHDPNRQALHRHHYEHLEAPSIRVVKQQ